MTTGETGGGSPLFQDGLVGPAVKRVHLLLQAEVARVLEPLGLRGATYAALSVLAERPGLRPGALAAALGVERSNIVVTLEDLERRGLVERRRESDDRRAWALRVTGAGAALAGQADAAVQEAETRALTGLTGRERARLAALLGKLGQGG